MKLLKKPKERQAHAKDVSPGTVFRVKKNGRTMYLVRIVEDPVPGTAPAGMTYVRAAEITTGKTVTLEAGTNAEIYANAVFCPYGLSKAQAASAVMQGMYEIKGDGDEREAGR